MGWLARRRERKKYLALFKTLATLLRIQTALIQHRVKFEDEAGVKNGGAIGYVYGFAIAALGVANLELENENNPTLMVSLYESLSEGRGESLFEYVIWHTDLPDVSDGIIRGTDDYNAWVNSQGEIKPMGIGRYFGMGMA